MIKLCIIAKKSDQLDLFLLVTKFKKTKYDYERYYLNYQNYENVQSYINP